MSSTTPSADISMQIQRETPGRSQSLDGVDYAPTASAPALDSGGPARRLPRLGIDDVRTQQVGFIERPSPGNSSDEENTSQPDDAIWAEDDIDAETDEKSEAGFSYSDMPDNQTIPDAIRDAERVADGLPSGQMRSYMVGRRYADFLNNLCIVSATEAAEEHTRTGLPYSMETASSISLDDDTEVSSPLDVYAFALVIHVWQLVCLRLHNGEYPRDDVSLSSQWSSYFLSAHALVEGHQCEISISDLKFATQYWEERLQEKGRGTSWLKARWAKDIEQADQDQSYSRNATSDRYLQTLDQYGVTPLTKVILEDSVNALPAERTQLATMAESAEGLREACRQIVMMLHSMSTALLRAIIQGQVPRLAAWKSGEVFDALWILNEGEEFEKPGIYLQSICDEAGFSPSAAQWLEVMDLMIVYIGNDKASEELAIEVDQTLHPESRWSDTLATKGLRRYMDRRSYLDKGRNEPDKHRRKMVRYFIDQLRFRLQNKTLHVPMKVPVVEIGFSSRPSQRLIQHRHHESSNYLMNLADALFEYRYPGMFRLLQRIIYKCFRPVQAWMAEIVFTQLAQGYVDGGGGFRHEPAGRFNGSSFDTLTPGDWESLEEEVYASGKFLQALQDEDAAVKKRLADVTAERDNIRKRREAQAAIIRDQTRLMNLESKALEILYGKRDGEGV